MISPNSLTQTIQHARWYAIYVLILLLTAYLLNQLDRYTLAVCTQPMAQDIHYGDQSCLENTSISNLDDVIVDVECHKIVDETQCITVIGADNTTVCKWDYNGQGTQYQLLVGPVFILIYTFTGIPLGFAADKSNRKNILAVCLIFWSAMTFLTGFAQEYWHLVILRFGLGMG
ncbi:uncharacterized protein LOC102809729, partial [Saccoglossus kowalevskii]|uniref:Uncharacterized protein LOC102809729 n=1 Tax=Saccoglossus kowalevskii TaxID=10224 RepID=A0ABM0MKV2_SACKO